MKSYKYCTGMIVKKYSKALFVSFFEKENDRFASQKIICPRVPHGDF
jgi:hypothetical protein